MTRIVIKKLIWDEWNSEHIKKHNITIVEVEEAIKNVLTHIKGNKGKYIAIGRSGKRMISIIIGRESSGVYYPVSARDAAKKERKRVYEKEK
jgi:uncharacterized DUF497 family protein